MTREHPPLCTGSPADLKGFTLIELSIVLVIIGLIVGGVLVGQDLIKAAQIRAQVSQVEKFKTAYTTFRTKYNALPGDIRAAEAASFGFVARNGAFARGDGNGYIQGNDLTPDSMNACGEAAMAWNDLSMASLIAGRFSGADGSVNSNTCPLQNTPAEVAAVLPSAALEESGKVVVYSQSGTNYFQVIARVTDLNIYGAPGGSSAAAMTPLDAVNIDQKTDDGQPLSGTVRAYTVTPIGYIATPAPVTPAAPAAGVCASNATTPAIYNTTVGATAKACSLRFAIN